MVVQSTALTVYLLVFFTVAALGIIVSLYILTKSVVSLARRPISSATEVHLLGRVNADDERAA